MTYTRILIILIFLMLIISACAPAAPASEPLTATPESVVLGKSAVIAPAVPAEPERTPTDVPTNTLVPSATSTAASTATNTATAVPSPTATQTATATPEYVDKLRGKVIIDQAVCHYGPGAPYLYKYGVYRDSNLELLRRVEGGNYIEIQAIGGNNPCWVRADYFEIKGDWMDLQPVRFDEVKIPISPYYAPPGGVSARRDGDKVTVFWNALQLRAGDDSLQTSYIVEAWVCQGGQNVFVPAGSRGAAVEIVDEQGCAEESYGYFIAAEKHGYTWRVPVPWPQPEQ